MSNIVEQFFGRLERRATAYFPAPLSSVPYNALTGTGSFYLKWHSTDNEIDNDVLICISADDEQDDAAYLSVFQSPTFQANEFRFFGNMMRLGTPQEFLKIQFVENIEPLRPENIPQNYTHSGTIRIDGLMNGYLDEQATLIIEALKLTHDAIPQHNPSPKLDAEKVPDYIVETFQSQLLSAAKRAFGNENVREQKCYNPETATATIVIDLQKTGNKLADELSITTLRMGERGLTIGFNKCASFNQDSIKTLESKIPSIGIGIQSAANYKFVKLYTVNAFDPRRDDYQFDSLMTAIKDSAITPSTP